VPSFEAHFTPAVEVGWRLSKDAWGNGYASEAARASLAYAFGPAGLDEVVSFTATTNKPSQRVMQRIGMSHDEADDFDHPRLEPGHRLERHVLYRITRSQWTAAQGSA
jgi:RimJ/RimL family protein N-acetyltransferase